MAQAVEPTPGTAPAVTYDDRVLAESVRAAEALDSDQDDSLAVAQAAHIDGPLEQKVVVRAKLLPTADRLHSALQQVRTVAAWLIVIAVVLSVAAGAGAARTALGGERATPVLVLPVLGGLLGVQSLLLLVWLGMWFLQPRSLSSASVGGVLLHAVQFLARKGTRTTEHIAAVQAYAGVSMHSSIARWKTGAISHGMWTAFNIGCVVLLLSLLSTRSYTFGWETTILPEDVYAPLIRTIGWLPQQLGFLAPSAEEIAASQWAGVGAPPADPRNAWPSFLIGSIIVYGALPRLLLLIVSLIGLKAALRRYRLDLSKPGYVRLRHRLEPKSVRTGIVDGDDGRPHGPPHYSPIAASSAGTPSGDVPILGIEIEVPNTGWPPNVPGVAFADLGRIETRAQRTSVLRDLRDAQQRPPHVVAVCAITTTPDRGIETTLHHIVHAAGAPLVLVLTAGHHMRQRSTPQQLEDRVADWRALADRLGIDSEHIVELDLDHATDASLQRLAAMLGRNDGERAAARQIEQACDVILRHGRRWDGQPDDKNQLALHTDLARLYRAQSKSWLGDLQNLGGSSAAMADKVKQQAQRSISLLPGNLRSTPIWALAGATAGALGCLAVASIITPAALAALPGWAATGGGFTTVLDIARKLARPDNREKPDQPDDTAPAFSDAIAAATLFALLLELQGRLESTISNVLAATLSHDAPPPDNAQQLEPWLDALRHRFDLAMAANAGEADA